MQGRTQDLRFGRSRVHAWGLFAKQDIEPEDFIIEYVGQVRVLSALTSLDGSRQKQQCMLPGSAQTSGWLPVGSLLLLASLFAEARHAIFRFMSVCELLLCLYTLSYWAQQSVLVITWTCTEALCQTALWRPTAQ